MTKFSTSDVQHLASLSGLDLSDKQIVSLRSELDGIVEYIDSLSQLDIEGVEPTYQIGNMANIQRADDIVSVLGIREKLMSSSPDSLDNQIKVPKVL